MSESEAFTPSGRGRAAWSWARSRAAAGAKPIAIVGVAVAVVLAAWLRLHGLGVQVVLDDEWHALHKLLTASYAGIFSSFGYSDHSIPLTLFYKAIAGTIGLDEINMRIVQAVCGIALVIACAVLAWKATAQAPTTILFAFLVADAPLLVFYSRFARPYAIVTLLTVLALVALWRWRAKRSRGLATVACLLAALAAWMHVLSALFPMAALAAILAGDLQAPAGRRARAVRSTIALGSAIGLAIMALIAVPVIGDFGSLGAKAGESAADVDTLLRVLGLFAGGLPNTAAVAAALLAAFGAYRFVRDRGELGSYLAFIALAPLLAVALLGAAWTHQGHTFARYVFPAQVIFLFWCAYGIVSLARVAGRDAIPALGLCFAVASSAAYLAFTPAIEQVRTLGPWYGHAIHHFDYVPAHNRALRYYDGWEVPRFYQALAALPSGAAPIIQAPFHFMAPYNPDAFYAQVHHQPELQGFVHDLCLAGPYYGELPRDRRFRFASFVHLDDRDAVLKTGARYLVFQRDLRNGRAFPEAKRCVEALTGLYGPPIEIDARLAVFDLQRLRGARAIQ
jgi:hypothetical protein